MTKYTYEFPRPALSVDIVIFSVWNESLQILLIQRGSPPFKDHWAIPGGFVKIDESLEDAACRELKEETNLEAAYLEQLYTYGHPERDPRGRVVTVAYFALVPPRAVNNVQGGSDAIKADWFPIENIPAVAFDHQEIIQYALRRLRYKLEYSAVGFELLPDEFTLSELQKTYEIILGERIDKRNFRRRILSAGVIEETAHMRSGEGRPARLYRYREDAVAEVKTRRLFP
jgi:8-oxo-dGTP diphosphatase